MYDGKASHNGPKNRNWIQCKIHYYIVTIDSAKGGKMENNVGEEDVKTKAPKPTPFSVNECAKFNIDEF